jgi:hypothetical protein
MTVPELIIIVFLFLDTRSLANYNRMRFSTYDRDLDIIDGNCAVKEHGAWWYHSSCTYVNLNGYYGTPGTVCNVIDADSGWCGHIHYGVDGRLSLRTSLMMIRRK